MTGRGGLDWGPAAGLEALRLRARVLARIRAFFARRGVLEVETPVLAPTSATDPALDSLQTRYAGPGAPGGRRLYLQTSPEFHMKRLLACGSGSIFQVARVFRNGEHGRRHNPEFTMLEWYRVGLDHHALMDEVGELVAEILGPDLGPAQRSCYRDLFQSRCGLDPHRAGASELRACAEAEGLRAPPGMPERETAPWLDLLFSHLLEPELGRGRPSFVYDFPACQAALARLSADRPPVARRFELFVAGVELANGFHELCDAGEQRRRLEADNAGRASRGLLAVPVDERLLAALSSGLPDCAGVALGLDRLVMLAAGAGGLAEVMAFPFERA